MRQVSGKPDVPRGPERGPRRSIAIRTERPANGRSGPKNGL